MKNLVNLLNNINHLMGSFSENSITNSLDGKLLTHRNNEFIIFSPISNLVIFINNDSLINLSPNILMK
jgi:hypothetical protein